MVLPKDPYAVTVSNKQSLPCRLSKTRRKRPIPEDWATGEAIQEFKPSSPSEPLYPGGHSISLNSSGELALVGGTDGVAGVYSLPEKRVVASLKGGSGAITDSAWVGDKAVIATSTGAVKVFENESEAASFNVHAGTAAALAVHPTGDIVASVGIDKSYTLYDISSSSVITQIFTDAGMYSFIASMCPPARKCSITNWVKQLCPASNSILMVTF